MMTHHGKRARVGAGDGQRRAQGGSGCGRDFWVNKRFPSRRRHQIRIVTAKVDLLSASMPGGLPIVRGRRPGVVLVPGVGASFLGVGVLDFRLGVDDLSFLNRDVLSLVLSGVIDRTHITAALTHRSAFVLDLKINE